MRHNLVLVAGAIMLLSSAAHAFLGWPAMLRELQALRASDDLVRALSAGWYWGSAAMAAFGLIVLLSGVRLKRAEVSGVRAILVVAACYLLFGLVAFFARGLNPHFLLFVATGLIAGIPVLGSAKSV